MKLSKKKLAKEQEKKERALKRIEKKAEKKSLEELIKKFILENNIISLYDFIEDIIVKLADEHYIEYYCGNWEQEKKWGASGYDNKAS